MSENTQYYYTVDTSTWDDIGSNILHSSIDNEFKTDDKNAALKELFRRIGGAVGPLVHMETHDKSIVQMVAWTKVYTTYDRHALCRWEKTS